MKSFLLFFDISSPWFWLSYFFDIISIPFWFLLCSEVKKKFNSFSQSISIFLYLIIESLFYLSFYQYTTVEPIYDIGFYFSILIPTILFFFSIILFFYKTIIFFKSIYSIQDSLVNFINLLYCSAGILISYSIGLFSMTSLTLSLFHLLFIKIKSNKVNNLFVQHKAKVD